MNPLNRIAGWLIAGSIALGANVAHAALLLSDGTFNNADWSAALIESNGSVAPTFVAGQGAAGGNPGTYREVSQTLTRVAADGAVPSVFIVVGHLFATTYNPAVQGAVGDLDFAWDIRYIAFSGVNNPNAVAYAPLLHQGGKYFVSGGSVATPLGGAWASHSFLDLEAADFVQVLANGTVVASSHPDFSTAGGVIEFGYTTGNGTAGNGTYTTVSGIDNWQVNIDPAAVPVPATAGLLAAGLAGLWIGRRRRVAGGRSSI